MGITLNAESVVVTLYRMLAAVLVSAVPLCGCSMNEAWDKTVATTQSLYSTYLNPPASVDYTDKGDVHDYQKILAGRMKGVELQLTTLERYMRSADKPPSNESVIAVREKFPWLSGVVAVDSNGEILAQEPPYEMKQLDFTKLLQRHDSTSMSRTLIGSIQNTLLGPECILAVPIYHNSDFLGLYVVHFDIRSLLLGTMDAPELVIASPDVVLWPGKYVYPETPLAGIDWKNLLVDEVYGIVRNERGAFCWMVRYLGGEPLIFATPVEGDFPVESGPVEETAQSTPLEN